MSDSEGGSLTHPSLGRPRPQLLQLNDRFSFGSSGRASVGYDRIAMASKKSFEELGRVDSPGIVGEFVAFMRENRKWWLAPVLGMLLLIGVLIVLGGTGAAPFIYTLF